jgi:hypothetical protein
LEQVHVSIVSRWLLQGQRFCGAHGELRPRQRSDRQECALEQQFPDGTGFDPGHCDLDGVDRVLNIDCMKCIQCSATMIRNSGRTKPSPAVPSLGLGCWGSNDPTNAKAQLCQAVDLNPDPVGETIALATLE